MARTRCYRDGVLADEDFPLARVSDHVLETGAVVWVDLAGAEVARLPEVAEVLGLHSLAVEDATSARQRPKFTRFENHDFLTAYAVSLDSATGILATHQVSAFVTPSALVTVRADDGLPIAGLLERWDEESDLTRYGVGALLHGLLDVVVDGHFEAVETLDD